MMMMGGRTTTKASKTTTVLAAAAAAAAATTVSGCIPSVAASSASSSSSSLPWRYLGATTSSWFLGMRGIPPLEQQQKHNSSNNIRLLFVTRKRHPPSSLSSLYYLNHKCLSTPRGGGGGTSGTVVDNDLVPAPGDENSNVVEQQKQQQQEEVEGSDPSVGGDSSSSSSSSSSSNKEQPSYVTLAQPSPGSPFHYAFPVHDIELAREFYGTILGCIEGRRSESKWQDYSLHGHQIVCHYVGTHYRCIDYYNPVDGDEVPVPHAGLALTVKQFHELANRIRNAGIPFIIEPHLRFHGMPGEQWTMFLKDPSNNNLEFKAMIHPENLFAKYNVVEE